MLCSTWKPFLFLTHTHPHVFQNDPEVRFVYAKKACGVSGVVGGSVCGNTWSPGVFVPEEFHSKHVCVPIRSSAQSHLKWEAGPTVPQGC